MVEQQSFHSCFFNYLIDNDRSSIMILKGSSQAQPLLNIFVLICCLTDAAIGCSVWDVLSNRRFPESLLVPDDLKEGKVQPFSFNEHWEDEDYFQDVRAEEVSTCAILGTSYSLV